MSTFIHFQPPFTKGGSKALPCNHPFSSINLLRYYISDTDPNSIAEHVQKCPIRFIGKDFANIWEFERGKRVHIFYVLVLTSIFYVFIGDTFEFYMWTISRHDILSIKSQKYTNFTLLPRNWISFHKDLKVKIHICLKIKKNINYI